MSPIPVYEPLLNGNEQRYVSEAIASGWVSSEGPFVERFEAAFAARVDREHGVAVSSGTMALQIALQALDLPPAGEVILPTFTIISCVLAVIRCGLTPVLVDADPNTWNVDVTQIEAKITPRTRAILMVHTYGLPCDVAPILALAIKHNLFVIEDAAQMHGQTCADMPCGSFGDVSIFSFYANKLVTTGEGGMVVTDDLNLSLRCRQLRDLDHTPGHRFQHHTLSWNARMTNLQAAVGCAQLERLETFVIRKRAIGLRYNRLLADIPGVQLPVPATDYAQNIYWAYGLVLQDEARVIDPIVRQLTARGIGWRPFFCPIHQQMPVLLYLKGQVREINGPSLFPVADALERRGFYIPGGLTLTQSDQERVADALREVLT
jgi:perosamine synthetase